MPRLNQVPFTLKSVLNPYDGVGDFALSRKTVDDIDDDTEAEAAYPNVVKTLGKAFSLETHEAWKPLTTRMLGHLLCIGLSCADTVSLCGSCVA